MIRKDAVATRTECASCGENYHALRAYIPTFLADVCPSAVTNAFPQKKRTMIDRSRSRSYLKSHLLLSRKIPAFFREPEWEAS